MLALFLSLFLTVLVTASTSGCQSCFAGSPYSSTVYCSSAFGDCFNANSNYYCPSSCTVSSYSSCSTSNALCDGSASGNLGINVGIDEVDSAKKAVTAGVTASVIIGVLLGAGIVASAFFSPCNTPPSPAMAAWKPRASSSFALLAVGNFFLALGFLLGLAGPAIPWFSIGFSTAYGNYVSSNSLYGGLTFTAITVSYTDASGKETIVNNPYTTIGAGISYFGLVALIFPALIMSWMALCRVSSVVKYGSAPPAGCGGGMPAIQGLTWGGLVVFVIGAAINWTIFGVIRTLSGATGVGPGGSLEAAAFVFLVIAAIFFSATGCCVLGPLPGVGTSSTNCCCTETDPAKQPGGVSLPAPGVVIATVVTGEQKMVASV